MRRLPAVKHRSRSRPAALRQRASDRFSTFSYTTYHLLGVAMQFVVPRPEVAVALRWWPLHGPM